MEEDSCQDSGEEEDGKSQGVKENKTYITKSEHEELKNITDFMSISKIPNTCITVP